MKGLTFCRNEFYDNSECVRRLPYEGQSWWVLQTNHVLRHKQFLLGNNIDISTFRYVKATDLKFNKIYALNHNDVNSYVVGNTNKVPELLEFNQNEHVFKFKEMDIVRLGYYGKSMAKKLHGYIYVPDENIYEILIR
jgi:hypothetical protein